MSTDMDFADDTYPIEGGLWQLVFDNTADVWADACQIAGYDYDAYARSVSGLPPRKLEERAFNSALNLCGGPNGLQSTIAHKDRKTWGKQALIDGYNTARLGAGLGIPSREEAPALPGVVFPENMRGVWLWLDVADRLSQLFGHGTFRSTVANQLAELLPTIDGIERFAARETVPF